MKPPHAPLQRESLYFMSLALILAGRYPVPPLDSGSPFRSSLCVGLSDPFFLSHLLNDLPVHILVPLATSRPIRFVSDCVLASVLFSFGGLRFGLLFGWP